MDIKNRKRMPKLKFKPPISISQHLSTRSLALCFIFFVFLSLLCHHFRFYSARFRPTLVVSNLPAWSTSAVSNSVQELKSGNAKLVPELWIESRVVFPDSVLVLLKTGKRWSNSQLSQQFNCIYHRFLNVTVEQEHPDESGEMEDASNRDVFYHQALSIEEYDKFSWIIRCPPPPVNYSAAVGIHGRRSDMVDYMVGMETQTVNSWDMVAYEAVLDKHTVVVFAKGLDLRSDRESDPSPFSCHFGQRNSEGFALTSKAITAAQEVFRCSLPRVLRMNVDKTEGVQVTVGTLSAYRYRHADVIGTLPQLLPSVAKIQIHKPGDYKRVQNKKFELCACTMIWNQASAIREWITYHAWLGVQRWFIYDNNSDDGLKEVIKELDLENYNVSRHTWPWIKAQEAGFSQCVVRAREECSWVGFFDVDEFFYFPPPKFQRTDTYAIYPGQNSLQVMVANYSSKETIAEIRTTCHSFGPSGLKKPPVQGLTLGYTCRLLSPERHKSIIRPDAVDDTLMNAVHHFKLKKGFEFLNLPQSTAVVNHYKYQVWDVFKAKFIRRVSTYVADWQENQKEGSRDRAPGLGTEAIEPPDWHLRFCEIWDTGLRDFVLTNFADPTTGMLPWERVPLTFS